LADSATHFPVVRYSSFPMAFSFIDPSPKPPCRLAGSWNRPYELPGGPGRPVGASIRPRGFRPECVRRPAGSPEGHATGLGAVPAAFRCFGSLSAARIPAHDGRHT